MPEGVGYEEEDEFGFGDALVGGALAGGAIASPLGRGLRRAVGSQYERFGSPLSQQAEDVLYSKTANKVRDAFKTSPGSVADIGKRSFEGRQTQAARVAARDPKQRSGFYRDVVDTASGIGSGLGALGDTLAAASASASRRVRKAPNTVEAVTEGLGRKVSKEERKAWKSFENSPTLEGMSPVDKDLIAQIFFGTDAKTPGEALQRYLRVLREGGTGRTSISPEDIVEPVAPASPVPRRTIIPNRMPEF